jgi:two-component system, OmpR family, KDP operon response regulator KdpE
VSIRKFSKAPVIILSARDREAEKISALDQGADDYVEKPFGIGELLARLRMALRHTARDAHQVTMVQVGDLKVDMEKRLVTLNGEQVRLTPKEYDLLSILAQNAGMVVTHQQILSAVWGPDQVDETQYLRVFIGQLRAKIETDPGVPSIIRTEPGVGYRFKELQN